MSTIGDLPHSLVASKIFSYLDLHEYAPLSTVSRIFRDLVYSDYPWIGPLRERGIVALPGTARQTFISHLRRVCTLIIDALPKVDQKARIEIKEEDKRNIVQLYQSITSQLTQSTVRAIFSQILHFPDPYNRWEFPKGNISPVLDFSLRAFIEVGNIRYVSDSQFSKMIKTKCSEELFSIFITKHKYIVDQGDVIKAISRDLPDRTVYLLASSVKPTKETKISLIVRSFLSRDKKFPEEMILQLVAQHPVCNSSIYWALTRGYSEPLVKALFTRYLETNPSDLELTNQLKTLHENNGCLYSDELILEFILHATEVKLEPLLREMYQARTETKSRIPTERVARAIVEKFPKSACEALQFAATCGYSEEFLLTFLDAAASHNPDLDTSRLIHDLIRLDSHNTPYPEQLILASLPYASSLSDWVLWYAFDRKVSSQTVRKLAEKVKEVEIRTLEQVLISLPSEIPEQRYLNDETLKIMITACQDIHLFPLDRALGIVSDEVLTFLLLRPLQIDKRTIHSAIGRVSDPIARILFRRGVEMFGKRTMYDVTFLWEILINKRSDDLTLEVIKEYDEIDNSPIELAKRLDRSKTILHALEEKLPSNGYIFF